MGSHLPTAISDLIYGLAASGVDVQRHLDAAWETEQEQFLSMAESFPAMADLLIAVAPQRLTLSHFDVACRVTLTATKTRESMIGARALNVSYLARYAINSEEQSSIRLSVVKATPS